MTSAQSAFSPSTAVFKGPSSMSPSTNFAPDFANCFAVARPMPLAPPVMTVVFPCSSTMSPSTLSHQLEFLTIDARGTLRRYGLRQRREGLGDVALGIGHDDRLADVTALAKFRFERYLAQQRDAQF